MAGELARDSVRAAGQAAIKRPSQICPPESTSTKNSTTQIKGGDRMTGCGIAEILPPAQSRGSLEKSFLRADAVLFHFTASRPIFPEHQVPTLVTGDSGAFSSE